MKIYLAGPEVFLPNAKEIGRKKVELCAKYGHEGLFPLDVEVPYTPDKEGAYKIYFANQRLIDKAEVVIANMTPFRGASLDVGTAWEIGYAIGLMNSEWASVQHILGYTNVAGDYASRVMKLQGLGGCDGMGVENFGLVDNLMVACSIVPFDIAVTPVVIPPEELYTDLRMFEKCLQALNLKSSK